MEYRGSNRGLQEIRTDDNFNASPQNPNELAQVESTPKIDMEPGSFIWSLFEWRTERYWTHRTCPKAQPPSKQS